VVLQTTNWEMVRLEILSSGCTATAYSTGIYAPTDRAPGHPVDGGITSGQQPENLNKIDAKIQLEGDLQMIDFNDFMVDKKVCLI